MIGLRRDHYAGLLVLVFGAWVFFVSSTYDIGTPTNMGPGFFPAALGVLMVLMGAAIMVTAGGQEPESKAEVENHMPDLRGWVCILASVGIFLVLASYAGLVAATFGCVFVAALGDNHATLRSSLLLAAGITVLSALLFGYGLQVQIPLVQGM